ncbi:MAG: ATP-binding protein [Phycisphaerales bacterium]
MTQTPAHDAGRSPERKRGLLASLRIRKKLILLHTLFSLVLAAILLVPLRPALRSTILLAEATDASRVAGLIANGVLATDEAARLPGITLALASEDPDVSPEALAAARAAPGSPQPLATVADTGGALIHLPGDSGDNDLVVRARHGAARAAALKIYIVAGVAVFAVYALVAVALEIFVLPRHVYAPIRRMLRADRAVQEGDKERELIPETQIPADELGEIMRSRNNSIRALRRHESALADALDRLEQVATDLRRKNHLLENARRNLEGADRLASLGMMSAGIAHELNTPLAVATGLVEKLGREGKLPPTEMALLTRVVGRLERLSESLLDFARARPPETRPTRIAGVIEEAATLVRLDRDAGDLRLETQVPDDLVIECDADRMVQVFVNLIRNAVDAMRGARDTAPGAPPPTLEIACARSQRDGGDWVSLTLSDNGPGLDPDLIPRLFEPFVSTRLDARGTGLGLAVADGIVREHAGVILARNRPGRAGAVFEVMLPMTAVPRDDGDDHATSAAAPRAEDAHG